MAIAIHSALQLGPNHEFVVCPNYQDKCECGGNDHPIYTFAAVAPPQRDPQTDEILRDEHDDPIPCMAAEDWAKQCATEALRLVANGRVITHPGGTLWVTDAVLPNAGMVRIRGAVPIAAVPAGMTLE